MSGKKDDRSDKFVSGADDFMPVEAPADPQVTDEAALQLRERYPDDEEFAAAMERLKAELREADDVRTPESES